MTFSLEILRHIPVNIWNIGRGNERVKTVAGRLNTYYSQTCIKRPCIKRSPSIKRSVTKVPKISPLNYSKCELY